MPSRFSTSSMIQSRGRRRYRRRYPRKNLARKVRTVSRRVNRLYRQRETKRFDTDALGAAISTTGTFYLLNGIAQGNDVINRDGNEVYIHKLNFKISLFNADSSNKIRVIIFIDSQANAAAPSVSDVLQDAANYPILTPLNYDNKKRFRILLNKVFVTDTDDPTSTFQLYRKIGRKVQYSGSAGGIATIKRNSLFLLLISDSNASSHPTIDYISRIYFTE